MSKIEELLRSLCPEGVDTKPLGEIWTKAPKSKSGVAQVKGMKQGDIICFTSGKQVYYVNESLVDGEYIFMNDGGSADTKYNDGKAYYTDHTFTFTTDKEVLITKFVYFYLKEKEKYINDVLFKGTGLKNINKKELSFFKIPIPPLEIQKEIVNVLDKFVQTEENLSKELKIRAKQFEYYRNKLMAFGQDVEWKTLDQACQYVDYRGKTPKKVTSGIFLVTAKNIRKGYIDYRSSQEYISSDDYELVMRRGRPKVGDVLITTEAPCGYVAQVDREDIALAQRVIKYRSKNTSLNNSFLKHYLLSADFQKKLDKAATGSTVKGIKGSRLHKLTVPVPSIDEQNKIISLLDKFDVLVNDIDKGIPAEINARHQQFEYYRKKLMTFRELPA